MPTNLEARRRIAFFSNSLFMDMPRAPRVRKMLSFRFGTFLLISDFVRKIQDPTPILFSALDIQLQTHQHHNSSMFIDLVLFRLKLNKKLNSYFCFY